VSLDIPFRLSTSADDADPDARLMVTSLSRRFSGHVVLSDDALMFEMEPPDGGATKTVPVQYGAIASAVLRPGHEAREFVAALQIRLADAQQSRLRTPPPGATQG
jgi:hypothetical protein